MSEIVFEQVWIASCASTQDVALRECLTRGRPVAVGTDDQTGGRGRLGRTWVSRPGQGLALSLAFHQDLLGGSADALARVSLAGGLASALTAEALAPSGGVSLRWPNDTVAGGVTRKLGGCLVEVKDGVVVVGIGMNVRQLPRDWDDTLRGRAVSLLALGVDLGAADLMPGVCARFESLMGLAAAELASRWRLLDCLVGTSARFRDSGRLVEGEVLAIDPLARILVRTSAGAVALEAATTTLLLD